MGQIGTLGSLAFEVSDETVRTLDNLKWSGSAKYATHQRHGQNSLTEFVGIEPDKISFDIILSSSLGVNVITEIENIFKMERERTTLPLVIGSHSYGKYRWVLQNHSVKVQHYDGECNIIYAKITLNLVEYLRS